MMELLLVFIVISFLAVHLILRVSVHSRESMTAKLEAKAVDIKTQGVAVGMTTNRVFRAGHVSLLLAYENGSYLLVHKEPNGKITNMREIWNMIRYGHPARIELIRFGNQQQLEIFQDAFQWLFQPIALENPHMVSEYVQSLMDAKDFGLPLFSFAGKNCVDFVEDLLKVGRHPRLPYHPIPLVFFDKFETLSQTPCPKS